MTALLKDKKVLITGGAGFIGSNLCHRLVEQGNEIICLDDLSTGDKENIEPLISLDNFTFIQGNIVDFKVCSSACQGVDVVLHQAALGSVPRSVKSPRPTHQANSSGTLNMLDAARTNGVKRFVYASSSSVYGDSKELPKREENTGLPLSPYAASKAVGEMYAKVFGQLYGMETIGLRYFNVFGRKQNPNGAYAAAIPRFIKAMIEGKPITIHGDGEQSRDFTYIENVIQANERAAIVDDPQALNQSYNIAFGQQYTVNELVELLRVHLEKVMGSELSIDIQNIPERPGDVKHSLADISKARKLLGYEPEFSLQQGLESAMKWYWEYFNKQEH